MRTATEKATAAVSSINEQYKITEGLANVASIVEKKGQSYHIPTRPFTYSHSNARVDYLFLCCLFLCCVMQEST